MTIAYLYKITNLITGKLYIGQTRNIKARISRYKNLHCKQQTLIFRSIKKYGWENHKFEIFCTCTMDIINELEIYFIQHFKSYAPIYKIGLNLTLGGDSIPSRKGTTHTKEAKEKIRLSLLGKVGRRKGIKNSEETRQKIRDKVQFRKIPVEQLSLSGKLIKLWGSSKDVEKELRINNSNVIACCKGRAKTAGGFKWKYGE